MNHDRERAIAVRALGLDILELDRRQAVGIEVLLDRLELAADIGTAAQYAELARVAQPMLDEWSETKRAPRHAEWLHTPPEN